jgi:hypothetical protein
MRHSFLINEKEEKGGEERRERLSGGEREGKRKNMNEKKEINRLNHLP